MRKPYQVKISGEFTVYADDLKGANRIADRLMVDMNSPVEVTCELSIDEVSRM